MRTALNRSFTTVLLLGTVGLLSACGTKGPLTLPPPPGGSAKPAPAQPAQIPQAPATSGLPTAVDATTPAGGHFGTPASER